MFQSKKKELQKYINERTSSNKLTPFDELLCDYLSGKMKRDMLDLGIKELEIHIDWLPDYHCIGIQGIYNCNYLDLQIEPTEFRIGYDPDEPDEDSYYPLNTKKQVYTTVKQTLEIS